MQKLNFFSTKRHEPSWSTLACSLIISDARVTIDGRSARKSSGFYWGKSSWQHEHDVNEPRGNDWMKRRYNGGKKITINDLRPKHETSHNKIIRWADSDVTSMKGDRLQLEIWNSHSCQEKIEPYDVNWCWKHNEHKASLEGSVHVRVATKTTLQPSTTPFQNQTISCTLWPWAIPNKIR